MTFNHKQKLTALGHVMALIAVTFIGYVSFLGLSYLRQEDIILTGVAATVYASILFLLSVFLQRLKATGSNFKSCIMLERLTAVLLLLACIPVFLPFTHFFTVNSHEREVRASFHSALGEVMPMFDEYDSIAHQRIDNYQSTLRHAVSNKKLRKKYGFDLVKEGKPKDGDTIIMNNMVETLRLQLLSPMHDTLRSEAKTWVGRARGATTWNVFLLGNAHEIRQAMENWQHMLSDAMAVRLNNEKQPADTTAFSSIHCQNALSHLDHMAKLCSERSAPPLHSILLWAASCLLLFFPHWLQNRHSKSWELFWGKPLTKRFTRKASARFVADDIKTIPVNLKIINKDNFAIPSTPASTFRKDMQKERERKSEIEHRIFEPFAYVKERIGQGLTIEQLLSMIKEDHNLFDAETINQCLLAKLFTKEQLETVCGIDKAFIDKIGAIPKNVLPMTLPISKLNDAGTQVFLWGLPSTGKTCALGVILAALKEGKVAKNVTFDEKCQGHDYQVLLEDIFTKDGEMCVLPGHTPVANNFAIRMTLDDFNGRTHPVTLIDMAGELFCTLTWDENGSTDKITDPHRKAKNVFEKVLVPRQTEHQKFHIFIIEYGAHDKKYKGFYPYIYLESGLQYLKEKEVMKEATQGIFVLVTKTDQVKQHLSVGEDESTHLQRYLMEYYGNFLLTLNAMCHDNELCGGHLPAPIPFDIGEVCLANYCKLNTQRAQDVVRLILGRSKGFRSGWLGKIERLFNH